MNQHTSFAIGIPTLNRWDLLQPTLRRYVKDFPDTKIYVWDNGNQDTKEIYGVHCFIRSDRNRGVAASWNILCDMIFKAGHSHAMILNDDVYLGTAEKDIQQLIEKKPESFLCSMRDFCAFVLPATVAKKTGPFDAKFMAYHEDKDYKFRMKKAGISFIEETLLNPKIFRDSSTLQKDPSIKQFYHDGLKYYIEKWGGEPGKEKFETPFNQ